MTKIRLIAFCGCLVASAAALAQNPPPNEPPPPPSGREDAIVNGKHIQPHAAPGEKTQDTDATRLLQQNAHDPASQEPIVVPRDIYGNPLGGNPGLNPPGLSRDQAAPKP
jgi:hypothetical protein